MDTQLVRHDAPYNIIFGGKNGKFAIQTATLVVIDEKKVFADGIPINERFYMASYPVVSRHFELDGGIWMDCEQKDCMVIARQGDSVPLSMFKEVVNFRLRHSHVDTVELASQFSIASLLYNFKLILPTDENGKIIEDYKVCLDFEIYPAHSSTGDLIVTSKDQYFYFSGEGERYGRYEERIINSIAKNREVYLALCRREGLRSITFTTKDENYQYFVDKLNKQKMNEGASV